jgi:hypothetical protein
VTVCQGGDVCVYDGGLAHSSRVVVASATKTTD